MSSPASSLAAAPPSSPKPSPGTLLICVPAPSAGALEALATLLSRLDPAARLLLATPQGVPPLMDAPVTALTLPEPSQGRTGWVLTAGDYEAAASLAQEHSASATLVMGSEPGEIAPDDVRMLLEPVLSGQADLTLPRYRTGPHEGLVSAALLYPLTRTLFGPVTHMPLPLDLVFSQRAAPRLGAATRRLAAAGSPDGLLWPGAEAASGSLRVLEVESSQPLPQPESSDLNALLNEVLGSLFSDVEAKASFWQRGRSPGPAGANVPYIDLTSPADPAAIASMVDSFRSAYTNLQQIWALFLPPHTLLALKKLSQTDPEHFVLPSGLWARTVYEFILAFHLRTLNRGHLLGALTPLYLAWVTSYLRQVGDDSASAARHIEETAAGFEAEKPYLVSRWRWPDRFNP